MESLIYGPMEEEGGLDDEIPRGMIVIDAIKVPSFCLAHLGRYPVPSIGPSTHYKSINCGYLGNGQRHTQFFGGESHHSRPHHPVGCEGSHYSFTMSSTTVPPMSLASREASLFEVKTAIMGYPVMAVRSVWSVA